MTEKIERIISVIIEKGDAIVAISGLFAKVGVCGIDLTGARLGLKILYGGYEHVSSICSLQKGIV